MSGDRSERGGNIDARLASSTCSVGARMLVPHNDQGGRFTVAGKQYYAETVTGPEITKSHGSRLRNEINRISDLDNQFGHFNPCRIMIDNTNTAKAAS